MIQATEVLIDNDFYLMTVSNWERIEQFSKELLESPGLQGVLLDCSAGKITITAANARLVYRPVGWDLQRRYVRAVLESYEEFVL